MSDIAAAYTTGEHVKLREFTCPDCATVLECETVFEDDPPLLDTIGAIPNA